MSKGIQVIWYPIKAATEMQRLLLDTVKLFDYELSQTAEEIKQLIDDMDSQHAKPLQLQACPATDGDTTMMTVINVELDKLFQDRQVSSQMHPTPLEAALYAAARSNDRQTAKYLIEKGVNIDGDTIVHAIAGKSYDVLDLLMEHGWDINLCLGHIGDALTFLLARGADPNRNLYGERSTALECAAYSASISTLKLLLDAGAHIKSRSALTLAAREGRTDVVAYLHDRGADVDEVPDNEDLFDDSERFGIGNALCTAACAGKTEVVSLLLERGANRQVRDTWGRSALDLAKLNHHADCEKVLS